MVEAIQYLGGPANGNEIVDWIVNAGGTAVWLDAQDEIVTEPANPRVSPQVIFPRRPEGIRMVTVDGVVTAQLGDFITKDILNRFRVVSAAEFNATFQAGI